MKKIKTLVLVVLILVGINTPATADSCGVIYPCFAPTEQPSEPILTGTDILDAKLWLIQNTAIYLP